ncbi:hypothetical protein MP638_003746, partial [Amoeboaphelidium occidentale]
ITTRRFLHPSIKTLKYKKSFNPAILPEPSALSKSLEWLKIRPDPSITQKTVTTQLCDGSVYHKIVEKKPLYAYVDPEKVSPEALEKVLPPVAEDHLHGKYGVRDLSQEEIKDIKRLRKEDHTKWTVLPPVAEDHLHGKYGVRDLSQEEIKDIKRLRKEDHTKWTVKALAEQFKCSKSQIVALTKLPVRKSKNRAWRWWYRKRYASAQVDYFANEMQEWAQKNRSYLKTKKAKLLVAA